MAINPNTDFTSGDVLTAAQQNRFPRGIMAFASKTTDTTITTTEADAGLSVTFTAVANRYYKYTFTCPAVAGTAGFVYFKLTDGSNSQKNGSYVYSSGTAAYQAPSMTFVTTESTGSITRKIRMKIETGSGTMYCNSSEPAFLVVEDLGPA